MADSSVTTRTLQAPPLTQYERRQFDRMTGAMGQLCEILPLIHDHAAAIINLLPRVEDEEASRRIGEAVDRSLNIRYLADLAALISAVEELRNAGETCFGGSLREVYERIIPWPIHADSTADIEAAQSVQ